MIKQAFIAAAIAACTTSVFAQSIFTYQGTLNDDGAPANGPHDLRFRIWDDVTPGAPDNQIGAIVTRPAILVTDGVFTVNLDFGAEAFTDPGNRYFQIDVRPTGDPAYTTLNPRQRITPAPRAIHAAQSSTSLFTQGLDLPITAFGGDADLSSFNTMFHVAALGTTGYAIRGDGKIGGVIGLIDDYTDAPIVPIGTGVVGLAKNHAVFGGSQLGNGIRGVSLSGTGGYFENRNASTVAYALHANSTGGATAGLFENTIVVSTGRPALIARTPSTVANTTAILGQISTTTPGLFSVAVKGENKGTASSGIGVWGSHDGDGWGIYGTSVSGLAGRFVGDVSIFGTISKSGGSFKIDHPQDPANMTLSHSFVESPDMKNIYDGVAVLNNHGQAIVTLPSYFNALNQDFRYQLTCIGGFSPVYIAMEIESSVNAQQFAIAGGTPGLKVSWQVTGIRHDAWANQNRIPTEEFKSPSEQGKYLNPEAFNQPKEKGIGYVQSEN